MSRSSSTRCVRWAAPWADAYDKAGLSPFSLRSLLMPINAANDAAATNGSGKENAMTELKDLTPNFRTVRLLLAREKAHPEGKEQEGYDLLVPLDRDGRLDPLEWKARQDKCRVRRFSDAENDRIGRLRRKPGGQWYFDYAEGDLDDELGFRLGEERFVTGEYVSIGRKGAMHTYQVARVEKP